MIETASICITVGAVYLVLCRIDKMLKGHTKPIVFIQHAVLGMGLFGSLLLIFSPWPIASVASSSAGIISFFLLSAKRWRYCAPEGTTRPQELDFSTFYNIKGGIKE